MAQNEKWNATRLVVPGITLIGLSLWHILALKQVLPLTTPLETARKFLQLITVGDPLYGKTLLQMVWLSLETVLKGVALGALVGLTGGLVLGSMPGLEREMRKIIDLVRPIPPLAWIPLAYILFAKTSQPSAFVEVFIVFVGSVFPILTSTIQGVLYVDQRYINILKTMGAGYKQILLYVLLPSALPSILAGLRTGLGVGWMSVIAAEFVSGKTGIGFYIWSSYSIGGRIAEVLVGTITIGIVGYLMNLLTSKSEERLIQWR